MKKRFPILALAGVLVAVAACKDKFLTEVPSDFVSPENFYRNEGDALAAINASYATFINLQSPLSSSDYVGRNFWMLTEYPTEVVTSRLSTANERSLIGNFNAQFNSAHSYLQTVWQAAYAGINRANSVIDNVPKIDMDPTRRDQIVAEAKFLRSLHYYWLAGLFGGVPLKLEETKSIEGSTLPRSSAQDTWAQIEKDLTEAAAVLPTSWPSSEYGRATKGAALALLGKAYLQAAATGGGSAGDYQKALDAFDQVMALGYSLDPDYASLFTGQNERSPEIIFSLQNVRVAGYGGRITEWFSPRTSPSIFPPGAQNQFQAERPFFDSYDTNDVRKAGTWLLSFTNAGKTIAWSWTSGIQSSSKYGSTGPVPRKYLDLAAPDGGAEEPDVIIIRYADVLLSAAEAINEISGPNATAYGYVDAVRARANVAPLTAGLTQDQFRDSLYVERRYELALEMEGVFDMRRDWPFAKSRIEAEMALLPNENKSPFTSSVEKFTKQPDGTYVVPIDDKWRLYPIPARACELNPELAQNPGWEDAVCKNP